MAQFIVRVELHDAAWSDYTVLHAHMAAQGFQHTILGSDGVTYQLPTAEYNLIGNLAKEQVLAKAKMAATATHKRYAIFVTESNGATWIGLEAA